MYRYEASRCMNCPHNMICNNAYMPMTDYKDQSNMMNPHNMISPMMDMMSPIDPLSMVSPMNMPEHNMPIASMPAEQDPLETMYPKIYIIIMPIIKHHCEEMEKKYGIMYYPSPDEMKEMVKDIHKKADWKHHYKDKDKDKDHDCDSHDHDDDSDDDRKKKGSKYERYPVAMDLVQILLIRELMQRRRKHHGHQHHMHY